MACFLATVNFTDNSKPLSTRSDKIAVIYRYTLSMAVIRRLARTPTFHTETNQTRPIFALTNHHNGQQFFNLPCHIQYRQRNLQIKNNVTMHTEKNWPFRSSFNAKKNELSLSIGKLNTLPSCSFVPRASVGKQGSRALCCEVNQPLQSGTQRSHSIQGCQDQHLSLCAPLDTVTGPHKINQPSHIPAGEQGYTCHSNWMRIDPKTLYTVTSIVH